MFWVRAVTFELERTAVALLLWPEVRTAVLWEVCGCEVEDAVDPVD